MFHKYVDHAWNKPRGWEEIWPLKNKRMTVALQLVLWEEPIQKWLLAVADIVYKHSWYVIMLLYLNLTDINFFFNRFFQKFSLLS